MKLTLTKSFMGDSLICVPKTIFQSGFRGEFFMDFGLMIPNTMCSVGSSRFPTVITDGAFVLHR